MSATARPFFSASAAHLAGDPGPLREPGQVVEAVYRREGRLRYAAEDRAIVGRNGKYFNNRPLYCAANTDGAALAGDRPLVRLIAKPFLHGAWTLAIIRQERAVWLHDFAEIESRYRCGSMTWHCADSAFPGLEVALRVVPLAETAGFAARLQVAGGRVGDQLLWSFGGARREEGDPRWNWDPVMCGNPEFRRTGDPRRPLLFQGMVPEFSEGNKATIDGPHFRLMATADATHVVTGRGSRTDQLKIGDAAGSTNPRQLVASAPGEAPVVVGSVNLAAPRDEWFFSCETSPSRRDVAWPGDRGSCSGIRRGRGLSRRSRAPAGDEPG